MGGMYDLPVGQIGSGLRFRRAHLDKHPIEAAERKIPSTTGNRSADTLKALLTVQEQEGAQGDSDG